MSYVTRFGLLLWLLCIPPSLAQKKNKKQEAAKSASSEESSVFNAKTFEGLAFRNIGPAIASGRIIDFAVNPNHPKQYYAAIASGGVWKTNNSGTTWEPIFDDQGSYSIGCVTLDPNNPSVVWVGTGENNSQRSVGYGDGVYKSLDGGKSWRHMGLNNSEHIAKIIVHPEDSNTVYLASQGPLWSDGGERGVYKSTDGGENWNLILDAGPQTGVTDLLMDPRDPNLLYAATYQRRRHVWTLINGGPESAIHKSTDGGATWRKVSRGLPRVEMGRIGLALAPSQPDIIYAIIEAAQRKGGFYRSTDRGESWSKQSGYVSGSPQYYQEIFVDPSNPDRIYSMDTWLHRSEDGGKNFAKVNEKFKHVDNHAMWIDPEDPDYLLVGCDGGIYESFDHGETWHFKANLPITQFYRVTVDQSEPFYYVYGGTQDNFTIGGPSRTTFEHGISNREWFITLGGDGFQSRVDPTDPNIVYSQYQYGGLARYDRASGERVFIRPQTAPGEPASRWNWDSPLVISPHAPQRLYFASQRVYRSDDRGDSWRAISPDLSRDLDRNQLAVMGRVQSIDAVSKNRSTSPYGSVVYLSESTLKEGLLVAGTDDGLIQITEDGGANWRKLDSFPGVPERTYVNRTLASRHSQTRVYAAFNNHKMGDFKPYALKSEDLGASWVSIAGNLPERGSVYALEEDPVNPDLLFAGTEFGVFFTIDGGARWTRLSGGIPTIAARDLAIQERENDLVVASFGRGFLILDDYTPLRGLTEETLEREAVLFQPKRAWAYVEELPLGLPGKGFLGDSFFTAPNPPFGAIFTYYLKEEYKSNQEKRRDAENELIKEGKDVAYPSREALKAELREEDPMVLLTVSDETGQVVRRMEVPNKKGFHRVSWNLRFPPPDPVRLSPRSTDNPFVDPPIGPAVVPGAYRVSLAKKVDGVITPLGEPMSFEVSALGTATLAAKDKEARLAFQKKTARLQRAVLGAQRALSEAEDRLAYIQRAILETPAAGSDLLEEARALTMRLKDLSVALSGDPVNRYLAEPDPPSISDRVDNVINSYWTSTAAAPLTAREDYRIAAEAFGPLLEALRALVEKDLTGLEAKLERAGAPWTPGRIPDWKPE